MGVLAVRGLPVVGGPRRFHHYLDFEGPPDGPVVVCVHGLRRSALYWGLGGPGLTERVRVLAVDLVGHGQTPLAGRATAVADHVQLLDRFVRRLQGLRPVLMGQSFGALVSCCTPHRRRAA